MLWWYPYWPTVHMLIKLCQTADKEQVLFWFNGETGCSMFDSLMMEVGLWCGDDNRGLRTIKGVWEEYTAMVYIEFLFGRVILCPHAESILVDHPAGMGFSLYLLEWLPA